MKITQIEIFIEIARETKLQNEGAQVIGSGMEEL